MTALTVLPAGASRDQWLNARREGIGGSDIGALLGSSPFATPLDVWRQKTTDYQTPESDAMRVGTRLEPGVIALAMDWLADTYGGQWWNDDPPALLRHPDIPVAQYSPDGIAHGKDATILLEAKVTSKWLDEPSPHWVAQVQWGLGITGLDTALIVAVNGSKASYWPIEADPDWFQRAAEYAATWWADHVVGGRQPDADPARDDLAIFRHADPDLAVEVAPDLVAELEAARADARAADARKKAAEQAVKAALGDATTGTIGGTKRVTWGAPYERRTADTAALKDAGLWDQYSKTTTTTGALRTHKETR